MKKTIFLFITLSVLYACNNQPKNEYESLDDETELVDNSGVEVGTYDLKKIAPEEFISQYNQENDTLYVYNFWATWCGPCKMEIPHFVKMQEKYANKHVKIVFISIDKESTQSSVEKFTQKAGMNNSYFLTEEKARDIISLVPDLGKAIPVTVFKKNKKTDSFLGMMTDVQLNEKLHSLLQ